MANPWWVEYIVASSGAGVAEPRYVQAATSPKAGGDIEWVFGPYPTEAAAQAAAVGTAPGSPGAGSTQQESSAQGGSGLQTAETEIGSIWDFVEKLGERSTWVRIGEFLAGGLLIAVCVKVLASETQTGKAIQATVKSAGKTAKKVGTIAAAAG
jgi:hypothetical protein